MDASGNLYGTTFNGGAASDGTVFELAAGSTTITTLASFDGTNGAYPLAGLIADSSGNLYGSTAGGASGYGTVFELAHGTGTITTLFSFHFNGASPYGTPIMDASGNLYGTASRGGPSNNGTVFELAAGSGKITTLASFNGLDGSSPQAGLVMDAGGNLYGTTVVGGASGDGTVFELAHGDDDITTLASFNGSNGEDPLSALVIDGSGNLYGTTSAGGASNDGTVFELGHGSGTLTTLASFNGTDGQDPEAGLVMDAAGDLYGTTAFGGGSGYGTIFELAASSMTIATLASFNGSNGQNPQAGLIMDSSANLYGTTSGGGAFFDGTVFELVAGSSTITTLASFDGTNGKHPAAGLVMDSSGNLYGTTEAGGAYTYYGTVFEVAQGSGTLTTLASFDGFTDGASPSGGLIMDGRGNLYGATEFGPSFDLGTVFELPGAAAPTDQWTGANFAVDTNWSDGANWSLGAAPIPGQNVLFTNNASVKDLTATVDPGFTNPIGRLTIDSSWSGTITVSSALTVTGNFILASGSFGGSGAVSLAGSASQWTGGQIQLGAGGVTNTGRLTADTSGGNLVLSGAGTLVNDGTFAEAGTHTLLLENTATLSNAAGATFDVINNADVSESGGGTLTNAGTLEKTRGTGTSTISSSFVNSGTIAVSAGTLALDSAGGMSTGGKFIMSNGATLDLTGGGTVAYQGRYTGRGRGTVALSGGTLAVGMGGATFHMAGRLFEWTGGTIDVTNGSLTNTGNIRYAGSSNVVLSGAGSLVNTQTILQTGTGTLVLEHGATLENATGSRYYIEDNGGIAASGGGTLVNAGFLWKLRGPGASTGTSIIATTNFSNTGTVSVSNGTLDVAATLTQLSGGSLTAGSWNVLGSSAGPSRLDFTSSGRVTTLGGVAVVTLSGRNATFTNLRGLSTIDTGASFNLFGQSLTTPRALRNKGSLTVGPGSILTVNGSFTQSSTGVLTIWLGGSNTAPTVGQLVSNTGTVALAGNLTVNSPIVPPVGTTFELLDNQGGSGIAGTFKGRPEGATFTVSSGTTTMTFQITYAGTDADGNQNVVITRIA
jgi:uncharacterized repeat protein (TIGR03803 family)